MSTKIDLSIDIEDYIDFYLIGIITQNYLFKTAFGLNAALNLKLKQPTIRNKNTSTLDKVWWTWQDKNKEFTYMFEWLTYENAYNQTWDLIANKSFLSDKERSKTLDLFNEIQVENAAYLLPKNKIYDQLLLIPMNDQELEKAMKVLKDIQGVQTAKVIKPMEVKNLEDLVLNRPKL